MHYTGFLIRLEAWHVRISTSSPAESPSGHINIPLTLQLLLLMMSPNIIITHAAELGKWGSLQMEKAFVFDEKLLMIMNPVALLWCGGSGAGVITFVDNEIYWCYSCMMPLHSWRKRLCKADRFTPGLTILTPVHFGCVQITSLLSHWLVACCAARQMSCDYYNTCDTLNIDTSCWCVLDNPRSLVSTLIEQYEARRRQRSLPGYMKAPGSAWNLHQL